MQNTKVPSQHTSWSAMTRSSWKCGLTVCTRFSINQLYIFQFDKMVCRHVFHVILLSWHGKLFSCCSRWRGSNFHSQVQASGVEVRIHNRLLKARETWNLSSGGLALEQQSPHCRKYFFPKYNVLKKTCKFAFFLFSKVGSHAIFCYDTFPEIPQRECNLESDPWAAQHHFKWDRPWGRWLPSRYQDLCRVPYSYFYGQSRLNRSIRVHL